MIKLYCPNCYYLSPLESYSTISPFNFRCPVCERDIHLNDDIMDSVKVLMSRSVFSSFIYTLRTSADFARPTVSIPVISLDDISSFLDAIQDCDQI